MSIEFLIVFSCYLFNICMFCRGNAILWLLFFLGQCSKYFFSFFNLSKNQIWVHWFLYHSCFWYYWTHVLSLIFPSSCLLWVLICSFIGRKLRLLCAVDWTCPPSNSHVETLSPSKWDLRRDFGEESRVRWGRDSWYPVKEWDTWDLSLRAIAKNLTLLDPLSYTSGLQNCEKCCWSHPVHGICYSLSWLRLWTIVGQPLKWKIRTMYLIRRYNGF